MKFSDIIPAMISRRILLAGLAGSLATAASHLPANKNVRWALGSNLWNSFSPVPFTEILDVMRDTGFIGIRLTQFPGILTKYGITAEQLEKEVSKRNLQVVTISFNGATHDASQLAKVLADARTAMNFLKTFGAHHLVVFSPSRRAKGADSPDAFTNMCTAFNRIGEAAGEMGFRAGLHNHLNQMVENTEEIGRAMALTNPKLFHFSPDTAHVHLAGGDMVSVLDKYRDRVMLLDYKDARREGLNKQEFLPNIFDLGDGEIDFPSCHQILKSMAYKGWICVDLDIARQGPRTSYERCGAYVVKSLEPIYA
jgi:sugar phosphate isomerase/epimerase